MSFFSSLEAAANLVNNIALEVEKENRYQATVRGVRNTYPTANIIEVDLRPGRREVIRERVVVREQSAPSRELISLYHQIDGLERHTELMSSNYENTLINHVSTGSKKTQTTIKAIDYYGRELERTVINIDDYWDFNTTITVKTTDIYGRQVGLATIIKVDKGMFSNGKVTISRY